MKKNRVKGIQKGEGNYRIKCTAIACLGGSAAIFVLLMLFSVILSSYDLPLGVLQPMAVLAILTGCFLAGFICARLMNQHGMVWGGICGGILFICLVLAQAMGQSACFGISMLPKCVMVLTAGMLGGVFGVNFARR